MFSINISSKICILFLGLAQSISCSGDFTDSGGPGDISSTVLVLIITILSAIAISNLDKYPAGAAKVADAAKEVSKLKKISHVKADLAAAKVKYYKGIVNNEPTLRSDLEKSSQEAVEAIFSAEQAENAVKIAEENLVSIKTDGLSKVANYDLQKYFHGSPEYLNIASATIIYFGFFIFIIYVYDLWGIPEFIRRFWGRYKNISIALIYPILMFLILFYKL